MSNVAYELNSVGYRVGSSWLVRDVTLHVRHGELLALVGPNGAGKSTLLNLLSGERQPSEGTIVFEDRELKSWGTSDLSRRRSVLTQDNHVAFPFRVSEVVAMGRAPWRGHDQEGDDDAAIADALARADVAHLADRAYTSLPGGEKARVSLARVLAQRTDVVMLDEPTAALDLRHQEDVMRVARELASQGRAVVVVLHDLTLAAAFADRMVVLDRGAVAASGAPAQVLEAPLLERVYGLPVRVVTDNGELLVLPKRE
jgi:iron complex transport system ATP-binding protein